MTKKTDSLPLYRRVVADALRLSWKHKHLWLFGFFATPIGFGGITEMFYESYGKAANYLPSALAGGHPSQLLPGAGTMRAIVTYSPYPLLSLVLFITVSALILAVFAWVVSLAVGSLIFSVRKIRQGGDPVFAEAMKVGATKFWPIFAINIFAKVFVAIAAILTSSNMIVLIRDRDFASAMFYLISFVIFTLLAAAVTLAALFATNFVIVKNEDTIPALVKGWNLLVEHWLVSLEMAIILFLINVLVAVIAVAGTFVLAVPVIFLFIIGATLAAKGLMLAALSAMIVWLLVSIVVLGAFATTYQTASWTLLWSELTERKPAAKLIRLAKRIGLA